MQTRNSLAAAKLRELRGRPAGVARNRIAIAVQLAGVTQAIVAEACGFSQTYLSDISRGRYETITVENARKLSDYFGCQIEDLFPAREAVAS